MEAGNFAPTDYACCDGANWVTVAEIPGYAPKAESMPHAGGEKPAGKSRKGIYLIAGIAALLITASALGIYFLLGEDEPVAKESPPAAVEKSPEPPAPAEKPPEPSVEPGVFDLTPEALVDVMMTEELGLGPGEESPVGNAFATFLSFALFGFLPLLSYVLARLAGVADFDGFPWACGITACALFALGSLKTGVTGRSWFPSGLETLLVGGVAAATAFGIGRMLEGLA